MWQITSQSVHHTCLNQPQRACCMHVSCGSAASCLTNVGGGRKLQFSDRQLQSSDTGHYTDALKFNFAPEFTPRLGDFQPQSLHFWRKKFGEEKNFPTGPNLGGNPSPVSSPPATTSPLWPAKYIRLWLRASLTRWTLRCVWNLTTFIRVWCRRSLYQAIYTCNRLAPGTVTHVRCLTTAVMSGIR